MPDGNKIVQLPSGERVQFPASMADADINGAIEQYLGRSQAVSTPGAFQQRPSGPILNARTGATSGQQFEQANARPELVRALNEFTLGATSGLSGLPETQSPITDMLKSAVTPPRSLREVMESPLLTAGIPAVQNTEKAFNVLKQVFAPSGETSTPMAERAHALGEIGGTAAQFIGGKETMTSEGIGKGAMREVMGEGASKARLLADQHAHALATKQHISGIAQAVHTDAQNAMSQVLAKVDEAHPEGAFNKIDIQDKVRSAVGDLVQVPEKMPPSVAKILKVEKPTWENLASQKDVSGFINRLKSSGLGDPEVRETLRNQGYSEREIQSAMRGGSSVSDSLTAEQLKQMRSDVGMELGRYSKKGVVGAALNKVYGVLSSELRGASANAGVEKEWLEANDKYNQYASDFIRGPLKRVLGGSTASGIMEPLTGATRQKLIDTLQKYRDAGFDVDIDKLQEEMRRYGMSKTVNRLSQPTKMDLLMAGFSPKALAIRQLGPRLMRNPKAIGMFAGEGFDTPISPKQVYPNKAAAMKAAKAPEYESEMEARRRGAPGINPVNKSIARHYKKENPFED